MNKSEPPASAGSTGQQYETVRGDTSLTQQAYERLHQMLVTLELKPGAMISENQLARMLDLGRTPVREAVHRLRQEGLLEVHKSQGILVPELSIVRQLQLLDVRRQLEPHVSVRAARNATEEQRVKMRELAEQIVKASDGGSVLDFMRVNQQIHAIKIAASNNELLSKIMESFYGLSMRFWYAHHASMGGSLADAAKLHADILDAIVAGDGLAASSKTVVLMDFLEKFTRQTLEV
jgi:DNA-binding GntR family transcriptional regulator